jgi:hypothetical protein
MMKDVETLEWKPATGFEEIPDCTNPGEPVTLVSSYGANGGVSWGPIRDGLKEAPSRSDKTSQLAEGQQDLSRLMREMGVSGEATRPRNSDLGLSGPNLGSGASASHEVLAPLMKIDTAMIDLRKAATESLNTHKADGAGASSSQGEN